MSRLHRGEVTTIERDYHGRSHSLGQRNYGRIGSTKGEIPALLHQLGNSRPVLL